MKEAYQYFLSLCMVMLVLAGVGGLAFHAFRNEGWFDVVLERLWHFEAEHTVVALPLTLLAVVLLTLRRRGPHMPVQRVPGFFVYGLMGAGVYFIVHFARYGTP